MTLIMTKNMGKTFHQTWKKAGNFIHLSSQPSFWPALETLLFFKALDQIDAGFALETTGSGSPMS